MPRRAKRESPGEERPDPRPTGRPGPSFVVEDGIRLSASRLWRLQRAFFERTDPASWAKSRVPSYITTNAFIARAMARVALAFLDDAAAGRLGPVDASKPIEIVELGAGSGRFAYGFARELAAGAARRGIRARYLATDLSARQVDALRANAAFAPFVKEGILEFAAFDAEDERQRVGNGNPLVVVANYFFDGIPMDLFEVAGGVLRESHLRLTCPEGMDPDDPATLGRFGTTFEVGPATSAPYGDAQLDGIVRDVGARLGDGHFLVPIAGLRLARRLVAMGGGRLLLLAADRGHVHEEALLGLDPPHLERHGSFSLDVNFHAFTLLARASGGAAFVPAHHPTHLATPAFLWGCADAARSATAEAFAREMDAGGPEDFFVLKGALERQKDRLDVERALAWVRASAWDGEVFHICAPTFLAGAMAAPPSVRLDMLDAARRVREGYFPIGEERDVPYALGEVFDALDALPEAEACFRASLAQRAPTPDIYHRLALCASGMHRLPEAVALAEQALALDPHHEPSRAMRVALLAEMRRRPSL